MHLKYNLKIILHLEILNQLYHTCEGKAGKGSNCVYGYSFKVSTAFYSSQKSYSKYE